MAFAYTTPTRLRLLPCIFLIVFCILPLTFFTSRNSPTPQQTTQPITEDYAAPTYQSLYSRRNLLQSLSKQKRIAKESGAKPYVLFLDTKQVHTSKAAQRKYEVQIAGATGRIRSGAKWNIKIGQTDNRTEEEIPLTIDPNGYLTYLPHSGFHNQRSALENAMCIAKILNRTLILPPMYLNLGQQLAWHPFDDSLIALTKMESQFAHNNAQQKAIMTWNTVFDMQRIRRVTGVRIIQIADATRLGITASINDTSTLRIRDTERYSYKIVDQLFPPKCSNSCIIDGGASDNLAFPALNISPAAWSLRYFDSKQKQFRLASQPIAFSSAEKESMVAMSTYSHVLRLDSLQDYSKKTPLIVFGSLFGFSRLQLRDTTMLPQVQSVMIYLNPILTSVADSIVEQIDPEHNYIGIHIRAGDGTFQKRVEETIKYMLNSLKEFGKEGHGLWAAYIATDLDKSRLEAILPAEFTSLFSAIYTLDSFSASLEPLASLSPAAQTPGIRELFRFPVDNIPQQSNSNSQLHSMTSKDVIGMWIPFIDQLVAARGRVVLGTKGSTFTKYLERLNREFWNEMTLGGADEWEGRILRY